MKAAVLLGPKDLKIKEVNKPDIGHGEVLVRIEACGICTLEQRLFSGNQKIFYPIVAGHEASGTIEAVHEIAVVPAITVGLELISFVKIDLNPDRISWVVLGNMCPSRYLKLSLFLMNSPLKKQL